MSLRVLAGPLLLLACSPPAAPQIQPTPVAEPAPQPVAKPELVAKNSATAEPTKRVYTAEELDKIGPRPAPVPPLTQEEIDLLAADPQTLTREQRIKQGYTRRRKVLQNPDSPLARQLEAMRIAHSKGELAPPVLPDRTLPDASVQSPSEPAKAP